METIQKMKSLYDSCYNKQREIEKAILHFLFVCYDKRKSSGHATAFIDWGERFSKDTSSIDISFAMEVKPVSASDVIHRLLLIMMVLMKCTGDKEIGEISEHASLFSKTTSWQYATAAHCPESKQLSFQEPVFSDAGFTFTKEEQKKIESMVDSMVKYASDASDVKTTLQNMYVHLYERIVDNYARTFPSIAFVNDPIIISSDYERLDVPENPPVGLKTIPIYLNGQKPTMDEKVKMVYSYLAKHQPIIRTACISSILLQSWRDEIRISVDAEAFGKMSSVDSFVETSEEDAYMRLSSLNADERLKAMHIKGNLGTFLNVCEKIMADKNHPAYSFTYNLMCLAVTSPSVLKRDPSTVKSNVEGSAWYGFMEYGLQRDYICHSLKDGQHVFRFP